MECDICERDFNARRTPICASCAQASLYAPRIEQAAALLGREKAHAHVEAVVRPGNDGLLAALPEDADWDAITSGIKSHGFERARAEKEAVGDRIRDITGKADELRRQIEEYKGFATEQRDRDLRRKKVLAAERAQLEQHRRRSLEAVQATTRKTKHRLEKVHTRTIEAREYLCKEASSLSGLRKVKNDAGRTEHHLNNLQIPDLKDLNGTNGKLRTETFSTPSGPRNLSEPHELISASLDNIARFLGITCHYLSIRLPAEIILPHNDFPHAAVLPRDSSYKSTTVPYPTSSSSHSSSPAASRLLSRNDLSRPRVLQLTRPLPQLLKEDPKAANYFIEGVALLAYDLVWLCRTQGIDSITSFDDISKLGSNLHHLFPSKDSRRPALSRNISSTPAGGKPAPAPPAVATKPHFGSHSHNSAHHSLSSHSGTDLPSHKLDRPAFSTTLTDRLKSVLRDQSSAAEWHVVDDGEWDDEMETEIERPVLVGGTARRDLGPEMSVMTIAPNDGSDDGRSDGTGKGKGRSGWMKLRGRGGEG